jgi:hypothetical protein
MEVTITSPYLIVQPFIPTTNVPQLFKNGTIKRKREITKKGKGRGAWELTLCLRIYILWSTGMGNTMPGLTLTPLYSWP